MKPAFKENIMDKRGHLVVSTIKSIVRITGCFIAAATKSVVVLSLVLIFAELCGVLEEVVD